MDVEKTFQEWVETVPERMRRDPLWQSAYYRLAMFLYDLVWIDCRCLQRDFRGREIVSQLVRSVGSVCANMEEAYGRGVGSADFVRIMRIALGEARETQGWYFRARHILPGDLLERRLSVIDQVIALLVHSINTHRQSLRHS